MAKDLIAASENRPCETLAVQTSETGSAPELQPDRCFLSIVEMANKATTVKSTAMRLCKARSRLIQMNRSVWFKHNTA